MFGRDEKKGIDESAISDAVASAQTTAGVRNLRLVKNGDTFELHGEADSISAKQQAMQAVTSRVGDAAGVINRISTTSAGDVARHAPQPGGLTQGGIPQPNTPGSGHDTTYTVQKGDTLSHIAQRQYGKASEYKRIFEANRDQLNNPDQIREGMTLRIPR